MKKLSAKISATVMAGVFAFSMFAPAAMADESYGDDSYIEDYGDYGGEGGDIYGEGGDTYDEGGDGYDTDYQSDVPDGGAVDGGGEAEAPSEPETQPLPVIARIDETEFTSLADAFAQVQNDQTIKLSSNIVLTNPVEIELQDNTSVSIDLNGYEIRMYDAKENMAGDNSGTDPDKYIGYGGMFILKNGTIKIVDSSENKEGKVTSSNESKPEFTLIKADGKKVALNIENGTYKASDYQSDIIKIKDSYDTDLQPTDMDGEAVAVSITGGIFNKQLPEQYIADGYTLKDRGDGTWAVEEAVMHNVLWQNWDGTELDTDQVEDGQTASYQGEIPTRAEDETYTYEFAGWDQALEPVYTDMTYTAIYNAVEKPTEAPTEEPTEAPTEEPTEAPTEEPTEAPTEAPTEEPTEAPTEEPTEAPTEEPTEAPTEEPTEEPTEAPTEEPTEAPTEAPTEEPTEAPTEEPTEAPTEEPTEAPTEEPTEAPTEEPTTEQPTTEEPTTEAPVQQFTITWLNWDGTVLERDIVNKGNNPVYYGATPKRPSDGTYSYAFAGWRENVVPACGNAVYTATYSAVPIVTQYTIIWQNYDGSVLKSERINNGETPQYTGATPTRLSDGTYTYTFIGWDKSITSATSDTVYVAQYKATPVLNSAAIGVYTLTSDNYVADYPVVYENGNSEVAYVELTKAFAQLESLYRNVLGDENVTFTSTYSRDGENLILTVKRENGSTVIINLGENTVTFTDYSTFSEHDIASEGSQPVLVKANNKNIYQTAEAYTMIWLGDYALNVYEIDGTAYMPMSAFSSIFMVPAGFSWINNGKDSFIVTDGLDETVVNGDGKTLKEIYSETASEQRSSTRAIADYNELCLMLDMNYGMKNDLGISYGFDSYFRQTGLYQALTSTSVAAYEAAIKELGSTYFSNAAASEKTNSYEEVDNTAYITIAKFSNTGLNYADSAVKDNLANYIADDTIVLIAYANAQIKREGSPIENVVIDITETSGNDLSAAAYVMGWILGQADINKQDGQWGIYKNQAYQSDADLDGQITANDKLDTSVYDVYCLISENTRDYGNLAASVLKGSTSVTVVGQSTGGGAHNILTAVMPTGTVLEFAGMDSYCTVKAGAHISIAAGVEPDVYIKDMTIMNDRYMLESVLANIQ